MAHPANNTIGGVIALERNIISGNTGSGIDIASGSTSNLVEGNWIGIVPTANGSAPLGNGQGPQGGSGITIADSVGNTIGGMTTINPIGAPPGNVISANHGDGILLTGADTGTTISGNLIGTDASGKLAATTGKVSFGNTGDGVHVNISLGSTFTGVTSNLIGGSSSGTGNVISNNDGNGIEIDGSGPTFISVQGNYIGMDISGSITGMNNGGNGVLINGAANNTIGGSGLQNVISGNFANGVWLEGQGASGNVVQNNLIGLGSDGKSIWPNGEDGIFVTAPNNLIGSTTSGLGNVITGNLGNGVDLNGPFATGNRLLANVIGLNPSQILITSGGQNANSQLNGVRINGASNNTIGANNPSLGNVIAGNQFDGILLQNAATGNAIVGNDIGVAPFAWTNYGNGGSGIDLMGSPANTIGGTVINSKSAENLSSNVIGGNSQYGVEISGDLGSYNQVLGNFIGTDPSQSFNNGNGFGGVFITGGSANTIGGTSKGAGNVITNNGATLGLKGFGVTVASGQENAIRGNSIFANGGRGIDLGNNPALRFNIPGGGTSGPNNQENYPVETAVQQVPGLNIITWTLNSTPSSSFDIDFFANSILTESGFGDGQYYLNSEHITTDSSGNATFTSTTLSLFQYISATATDSLGNTSEFSMVSSAADGIADTWKINGIDLNGDGTIDFTPPDATPMQKDVYVEVDAMNGFAPQPLPANLEPNIPDDLKTGTYLDLVVAAFYYAPVDDPDGTTGINLHIEIDQTSLPVDIWNDQPNGWPDFYSFKSEYFGTVQGQPTPSETTLQAMSLVYRYCVFANESLSPDPNNPGSMTYGRSGWGEIGGNDFFVTLGDWMTQAELAANGYPFTFGDFQAAAFMHELGHTFGLLDGGGDNIDNKLNYQSVMNYLWEMPEPWMYESWLGRDINGDGNMTDSDWTLEYSAQVLPPLNEQNLNDSAGIGGIPDDWVLYPLTQKQTLHSAQVYLESVPIDWAQSGVPSSHAIADINNDGSYETLQGYDDWANLQFNFLGSPYFQGEIGGNGSGSGGETFYEWEELAGLVSFPSGPGTLALTAATNEVTQDAGSVTIGVSRTGGTTGAVSIAYTTSPGTATPGTNYATTSGVLNFIAGQLSANITVPILDNTVAPGGASFTITLSDPTGGAVLGSQSSAVVTIDEDGPATYMVTNTADSGPGSLRQAILDSNAHPFTNTIDFDITGGTIILPQSPLPPITNPVIIDATTEPGYAGTPLVQITGLLAGAARTASTSRPPEPP